MGHGEEGWAEYEFYSDDNKYMNIRARLIKNSMLLFFPIMLGACSIGKIDGTYHRKFETLELKPDSSYFYKYRMEWPKAISRGTWSLIQGNRIRLVSAHDIEMLPMSVSENHDSIEKRNILQIVPEMGIDSIFKQDLSYELILDGQITGQNKTGKFYFNDTNHLFQIAIYIDSNKIAIPTRPRLLSEKYLIKNINANRLKMSIPISTDFFYYDRFITDTLSVKKNRLFWKSKGAAIFKRCKQ